MTINLMIYWNTNALIHFDKKLQISFIKREMFKFARYYIEDRLFFKSDCFPNTPTSIYVVIGETNRVFIDKT